MNIPSKAHQNDNTFLQFIQIKFHKKLLFIPNNTCLQQKSERQSLVSVLRSVGSSGGGDVVLRVYKTRSAMVINGASILRFALAEVAKTGIPYFLENSSARSLETCTSSSSASSLLQSIIVSTLWLACVLIFCSHLGRF